MKENKTEWAKMKTCDDHIHAHWSHSTKVRKLKTDMCNQVATSADNIENQKCGAISDVFDSQAKNQKKKNPQKKQKQKPNKKNRLFLCFGETTQSNIRRIFDSHSRRNKEEKRERKNKKTKKKKKKKKKNLFFTVMTFDGDRTELQNLTALLAARRHQLCAEL